MDAVRTPDDRFDAIPDFPYAPHYVSDLEGLHGEPTWSFLYRKMIPIFLRAGARVVAPDFLGFGRSDKPVHDADYTVALHRHNLVRLLERLDLRDITLVCQDWGGLLGLTLPMDHPDRFRRLIVMNTTLPIGVEPTEGFVAWRQYVRDTPDFPVGRLMKRSAPSLTDAEVAAYDAPFPDATYKAGVRTFPALVPTTDHDDTEVSDLGRRARAFWRNDWQGQSFMAVGAQDPVLGVKPMAWLQQQIRGCPPPLVLDDAGHFVQEAGDRVANAALAAFAGPSASG